MTTPTDLSKLRGTKGCGKKVKGAYYGEHFSATTFASNCDPCLSLLVEAARAGAVEECVARAEGWLRRNGHIDASHSSLLDELRALLPPPSTTATECEHKWERTSDPLKNGHRWECVKCGKPNVAPFCEHQNNKVPQLMCGLKMPCPLHKKPPPVVKL